MRLDPWLAVCYMFTTGASAQFDESLICGGSDIQDEYKFRFNGSTNWYCFFRLADSTPHLIDRIEDPNEDEVTRLDRIANLTAARQYCEKYSATLPLMVSAEMHEAIRDAAQSMITENMEQPVVPLGISKIIFEDTLAHVTWDNGQYMIVPLTTTESDHKYFLEYQKEEFQYKLMWADIVDAPDSITSFHEQGAVWFTTNKPKRSDIFVICQQNLTELLGAAAESISSASSAASANASSRSSSTISAETVQTTLKSKTAKAYLQNPSWLHVALVFRMLMQI